MLVLCLVYIGLYNNVALGKLKTLDFMNLTILAFVAGLVVSIIIKYSGLASDYNISSVAILAFSLILFGIFGDVEIGEIAIGSLLLLGLTSVGISIGAGLAKFLLIG